MTTKIPVTVLGATGVVGQRFVRRLANHPLFRVEHLAASERSAGKRYRDACAWRLEGEPYGGLGDQADDRGYARVACHRWCSAPWTRRRPRSSNPPSPGPEPWCSRMPRPSDVSGSASPAPEVNAAHLGLLKVQRHHHGWTGGIITNANCTATVLVMALAPCTKPSAWRPC